MKSLKGIIGLLALVALLTTFVSLAMAEDKKGSKNTKEEEGDYYEEEQAGGINYEDVEVKLDQQDILRVIKKKYASIRSCYETVLQTNQKLKGRLVVHFNIELNGKVSGVNATKDSTMKEKKVVQCVLDHVKSLIFPERKKGEPIEVNFPFNFQPKNN